ncbi:hypothetical protein TCE0_033r09726 [Talaromyces pinophilus]|uniref:Uncharacterized protein n=1 Tax=Talaromyces pinophilus TaxID=128442 RepID=A0A6V8HE40_TALPI|nr:hypothetical protein TCE0_033r09726 [Talaromyces pinophilus]
MLTHGDLDWSNVLVDEDKDISRIIDWECSGYSPAYWEWVTVKRFCPRNNTTDDDSDEDSWFQMLERRLRPSEHAQGKTAWELERLYKALGKFTQWALMPEARRMNRGHGWAEVCGILELDIDEYPAPPVDYTTSSEHPWWLEDRHA